ncbi:PKD domain-containing protein, partial [Fulvivirga sp. RKSG066]|uniref:PKD domain-containing protein n=1 Tax=Fulvivirga aurantia TaxID=2529383 RepID=UPI0012BD6163
GTYLGELISTDITPHLHLQENNTVFAHDNLNPYIDADTGIPVFIDTYIESGVQFYQNGLRHNTLNHAELNLTDQQNINNVSYTIIYDKIDIVAHAIDPHVLTDGSGASDANGNPVGQLAPYGITYRLLTLDEVNLYDYSLEFDRVPDNTKAVNVFHPTSGTIAYPNPSIHIVTSCPANCGNDDISDRFFNTRLKKDKTENWDLSNRSEMDATFEEGAEYPDSKYILRLEAYDVDFADNPNNTSECRDINVIIDNFKPYIEKVQVVSEYFGVPITHYSGGWANNSTSQTISYNATYNENVETSGDVEIIVTASEPLYYDETIPSSYNGPEITVNGVIYQAETYTADLKEFTFRIPAFTFDSSDDPTQIIEINAEDLAGNQLVAFNGNDVSANYDDLPHRNSDGTWANEGVVSYGTDTRHSFNIGNSCGGSSTGRSSVSCPLISDFRAEMHENDALGVLFTSMSTPSSEIDYMHWEFGDGNYYTKSYYHPQQYHTYSTEGIYSVSLTVGRGVELDTYTTDVIVSNDLNAIANLSSSIGSTPLLVTLDGRSSTGVIQDYQWNLTPSTGWYFKTGTAFSNLADIEFTDEGSYQVTLTVTDENGKTDVSPSQTVSVSEDGSGGGSNPLDPVADFEFNNPVFVNSTVSFSNTSQYGCASGVSFSWDFGNGNTSTLEQPVTNYSANGNYPVELCVTDGCGNSSCTTKSVSVQVPNEGIIPRFTADRY